MADHEHSTINRDPRLHASLGSILGPRTRARLHRVAEASAVPSGPRGLGGRALLTAAGLALGALTYLERFPFPGRRWVKQVLGGRRADPKAPAAGARPDPRRRFVSRNGDRTSLAG